MAKSKPKFYVVWQGRVPGIYTNWTDCEAQIKGFQSAQYRSYPTLAEARQAFAQPYVATPPKEPSAAATPPSSAPPSVLMPDPLTGLTVINPEVSLAELPLLNAIAVDAACSGNPGVMEYQGVYIHTRQQLFHYKAPVGTNNIGEFLAIVHGLAYIKKNHIAETPLYSDSVNAMLWIKKKQCRSKLARTPQTEQLWQVVERAEQWLHANTYDTPILKWQTHMWGEIPADFNRK